MIIGFVGVKGAGKTTLAQYLLKTHGFETRSFAGPLKKMAAAIGFTHSQLYGTTAEKAMVHPEWGISAREFLQVFGTEVCRNQLSQALPRMDLGSSGVVWTRCMEIQLQADVLAPRDVCCDDVRFLDEVQLIRSFPNSYIILIQPSNQSESNPADTHPSEMLPYSEDLNPDFIIENDGENMLAFKKQLQDILTGLTPNVSRTKSIK